jgi:hypothetical protein
MNRNVQPTDFVIRMQGVSVAEAELENLLGISLDRYEASPDERRSYAQVAPPHGSHGWESIALLLERIGPTISDLIKKRAIDSATIDLAIHFAENMATISSRIPSRVAELAGQNQIGIDVSVYLTSSG